jgi:hypothetical protein
MSQYPHVIIVYRPGKDHVNADALSRLKSVSSLTPDTAGTHGVFGFVATVVGLSMPVLIEFTEGYKKDRHFSLIYDELVRKLNKQEVNVNDEGPVSYTSVTRMPGGGPHQAKCGGFLARRVNGHTLLYIEDQDRHPRLCVPSSCHRFIFKCAHDDANHAGFERAYKRLRPNYYIKNLSGLLRSYVTSCPSCLRNNPDRHKPFGQLQPSTIPAMPFEMVTLDLVVKLPNAAFDGNMYDSFMTITDKLTKMVTVILGRENWAADRWALAFWHGYYRRWGIPQRVLSDRGKIFLSELWMGLFRLMRTDLLVTTAYHPQSDGQSERTNQTVEIALRHLVGASKTDWPHFLTEVEFNHNNMVNTSTNKTPMEMVTGLNMRSGFQSATPDVGQSAVDWTQIRQRQREEAYDALVFAQAKMSIYYDRNHQPVAFKPGDRVFISLAKGFAAGYKLPHNVVNRKLSQQHVGPFAILEAIGPLAYRLDIPSTWKIHPIISVVHLKPAPPDPFNRDHPPPPDIVQDDTGDHEEYEVEEVLDSRLVGRSRKRKQYWVKWKGWGPEHNQWIGEDDMSNARDLVEQFESRDSFEAVATTPIPLREGRTWSSNLHTPRPPRPATIDRAPSPGRPALRRRVARIAYPPAQE